MENVITTPVTPAGFSVARSNTITTTDKAKRPLGFVVREKLGEDNKPISLELGVWTETDVWMGIPVHFSMKYKFVAMAFNDDEYKYYVLPKEAAFGVKVIETKKGTKKAILVSPSKTCPRVFITACAHGSKSMIESVSFGDDIKILKKIIDKSRRYIAFIGFKPVGTDDEAIVTICDGVPNTNTLTITKYTANVDGIAIDTENITVHEPIKTKFIDFPIYEEIFVPREKPEPDSAEQPKKKHYAPKDNKREDAPKEKKENVQSFKTSDGGNFEVEVVNRTNNDRHHNKKNKDKKRRDRKFN